MLNFKRILWSNAGRLLCCWFIMLFGGAIGVVWRCGERNSHNMWWMMMILTRGKVVIMRMHMTHNDAATMMMKLPLRMSRPLGERCYWGEDAWLSYLLAGWVFLSTYKMPLALTRDKSTASTNKKIDPSDLSYGTTLILKRQVPPFHYVVGGDCSLTRVHIRTHGYK